MLIYDFDSVILFLLAVILFIAVNGQTEPNFFHKSDLINNLIIILFFFAIKKGANQYFLSTLYFCISSRESYLCPFFYDTLTYLQYCFQHSFKREFLL